MNNYKNYKANHQVLLGALLSESHWLHLLKNKTYDRLKNYLINLPATYEGRITPTLQSIETKFPELDVEIVLRLMAEDLLNLNAYHPEHFKSRPDADRFLLTIAGSGNKMDLSIHAYNIWSVGTVKLNDNVYLPILEAMLPKAFYYVDNIRRISHNGEIFSEVSICPWSQNRYANWLNQKSLNPSMLTFSEIVYTRHKQNIEFD